MEPQIKMETPPSRPLLITQRSVTRSGSIRSKGINFNTVSPTPGSQKTRRQPARSIPREHSILKSDSRENGSPNPDSASLIDRPLPLYQELRNLNIDDQLRLLALKEMAVVAINDSINTLKLKLNTTQKDLQQLRHVIQKSLYKEVHKHTQKRPSAPENQPNRRIQRQTSPAPDLHDHNSTIWSNLSKPISFLQQLDTMIQSEMEKSLGTNEPAKELSAQHEQHKHTNVTNPSEEKLPVNLDKYFPASQEPKYRDTDDMFHAVSSSLWSFVSEVKTNMMSSLADEPEQEEKNEPDGNDDTINLIDMSEPSFSKDEEEDKLDLSMYSSMRQSKQ